MQKKSKAFVLYASIYQRKGGGQMNTKLVKSLVSMFIAGMLALSGIYSSRVEAAVQIPEMVRIGLYFRDSKSHNINSALTSFEICADKGIQIGFEEDGEFNVIHNEPSANRIIIKKDTYYTKNNGVVKEYNPADKKAPADEKTGPFHIKIGKSFSSLKALRTKLNTYKQKDIEVYPAYTDAWQIWTGFYTDYEEAQQDLNKNLANKLDKEILNIVEPEKNRVVVSEDDEVLFVFGSDKSFMQIRPDEENEPYVLKLNNICYRGSIEVRRNAQSDMTVINVLPLEHYLYGVLPGEIEPSANPEALKAQAVASRTYVLSNMGKHGELGFDLCNTTGCQVYKGFSCEKPASNKAADDTENEIVMYEGSPAKVYYFSSSGGMTEDVRYVWGDAVPYLTSVSDKYESGNSWNYNWQFTCTADEIKKIMIGRNIDIGDIVNVEIREVSPAGRVTELAVIGTSDEVIYKRSGCKYALSQLNSQWYTISTDAGIFHIETLKTDFFEDSVVNKKVMTKNGLQSIKLRDNKITIISAGGKEKSFSIMPTAYTFTGKGWGHSVGMSQEGAKGMADAGFAYDEILKHYFQGTTVE